MKSKRGNLHVVNGREYYSVAVLFADPMITYLFASLLQARGVQTQVVHDADEVDESIKVITEPQYYSQLPPAAQRHCLLVCSKEPTESDVICLSQPLTEDKVEAALARFLSL